MQTQNKPLPAREMHKIVLGMVGVFGLLAITFPVAMIRVSQMDKFRGFHVKSLPLEMKNSSGELPDIQPVVFPSPVVAIMSSTQVKTSSIAEITDLIKLEELNQKLYEEIDRRWQTRPTFEQNLIYRVSVDIEGAIVGYQPLNQQAKDYVKETPLSHYPKDANIAINTTTPVGKFIVVFSPNGILEVNR
ncbi:hypothetical protein BCD67_17675 [Oscillatoriales cyanobacterium USR001]|nr:hypothetical protein BCD67_17675 [Oscillatoriales cyanobacterium USR001]